MTIQKDFDDAVQHPDRATVIQAGASWCNPCQVLKPKLIEAIKKEKGAIDFLYIDVDKHRGIAEMLQVSINFLIVPD
jgi:thioredoxin-like negative regulator of GroEL